jgi:hypothetical protein
MKKMLANIAVVSILIFAVALNSSAALPELGAPPPEVTLPYTFSASNNNGSIDIDGNDVLDFYVSFAGCTISVYGLNSGRFLYEDVSFYRLASILPDGVEVGSVLPAQSDGWYYFATIANFCGGMMAPLSSNHMEGETSGYLGLEFMGTSGTYYGWISVDIDDFNQTVTLGNTLGVGESPGSSVLTGSGSVVPVPLIATAIGFMAIGTGLLFRRKRKKA